MGHLPVKNTWNTARRRNRRKRHCPATKWTLAAHRNGRSDSANDASFQRKHPNDAAHPEVSGSQICFLFVFDLMKKLVRAPLTKSCSCTFACRIEAIRTSAPKKHLHERVGHQSPIEFQGGESLLNFGLIKSGFREADPRHLYWSTIIFEMSSG
jgi:hypothetical protein